MATNFELSQIEEFFNSQRAKARWPFKLLDCTDWQYMMAWQKDGIPFVVICRGIEESFENHLRRNARGKINTVRYCENAIKDHWKNLAEAHIGGHHNQQDQAEVEFSNERIIESLQGWIDQLQIVSSEYSHGSENISFAVSIGMAASSISTLKESLTTYPDLEKLDAELLEIEKTITAALIDYVGREKLDDLTAQAEKQFAKYRDIWMPGMWAEQIQKFIEKKLREEYKIPRLSLFYL